MSNAPQVGADRNGGEMRIALVRQTHNATGGGALFADRLASSLARRGHDVTLIARSWPEDREYRTVLLDPPAYSRSARDVGFANAVSSHLLGADYDVVQTHERIPGCDIARLGDGVHAAWLHAAQHGSGVLSRLWRVVDPFHRRQIRAESRMLGHPDLLSIIANSERVRDDVTSRFEAVHASIDVIPNGIYPGLRPVDAAERLAVRRKWGIELDDVVFLLLGSGFERKGYPVFREVLGAVGGRARGVVIGSDRRHALHRRRAARGADAGRVRIFEPTRDPAAALSAADVLFLPARYDPFPSVVLEAMHYGRPVVVSSECGASEIVEEDVSGYVRDADDRDGFAGVLRRLLDDERRTTLGAAARQTATRFSFEAMVDRYVRVFENVVTAKSQRAAHAPGGEGTSRTCRRRNSPQG